MTEQKLLIVVPSRGRPKNVERLRKALVDTLTTDATVVVCLDDDDAWQYPVYADWAYLVEPRMRLAAWVNFAVDRYRAGHTHMILLGDDVVPETVGWDERLLAALSDVNFGISYGDDGIQHENLPTHAVVSLTMYDVLGWVALPLVKHLYLDNVWKVLAEFTGTLRYLPDVKLTHMHRNLGLAEDDLVYREANDSPQANADRAAFAAWHASSDFVEAAAALAESNR